MAGPSGREEEDALPTYKDAFPPLPERAATPDGTQETTNAWTKIRPLKSSIITQVDFCSKDLHFRWPLLPHRTKDLLR